MGPGTMWRTNSVDINQTRMCGQTRYDIHVLNRERDGARWRLSYIQSINSKSHEEREMMIKDRWSIA